MVKESLNNPNLTIEADLMEKINQDVANYRQPLSDDEINGIGPIRPAYTTGICEQIDLGEDFNSRVTPTISTPLGSQFNSEVIKQNNERRLENQIALENQQDKNNQYKAQIMVDCLTKVADKKREDDNLVQALIDEHLVQVPSGLEEKLLNIPNDEKLNNSDVDYSKVPTLDDLKKVQKTQYSGYFRQPGEPLGDYYKRHTKNSLKRAGKGLIAIPVGMIGAGIILYATNDNFRYVVDRVISEIK